MREALNELNSRLPLLLHDTTANKTSVAITPKSEEEELPYVLLRGLEGGQRGDIVIVQVCQDEFMPWLGSLVCDGMDLGALIDRVDILLWTGGEGQVFVITAMDWV